MGQNNDTTEHGDKQGQQGGQQNKTNPQEPQRQQQKSAEPTDMQPKPGLPEENIAGGKNLDKNANK